ncbi:Predicted phosphatase [hydrothermal vent metagenome]|uniref:Predicted phosphatase n=1 Tax=hydrothermal vent metagenome TaxID=652676 RepID=A0A1W1CGJ2_9ZZZZ
MRKRVIIFDMDGTLVNSSLTIANAINYVRGKINLPPMDRDLIAKKVNDHTLNSAMYFYEVNKFEKKHELWFSQYYTENHKKELVLYDGILELLKELKENGFKLAVATNAYKKSTIESLNYLNILNIFDAIACHDEVKQGKPYPDMLYKVLDDLNLEAKDAIFIGDGSRDKIASERANIDYIMINWGFSQYDDAIKSIEKLRTMLINS